MATIETIETIPYSNVKVKEITVSAVENGWIVRVVSAGSFMDKTIYTYVYNVWKDCEAAIQQMLSEGVYSYEIGKGASSE